MYYQTHTTGSLYLWLKILLILKIINKNNFKSIYWKIFLTKITNSVFDIFDWILKYVNLVYITSYGTVGEAVQNLFCTCIAAVFFQFPGQLL